MRKEIDNHHEKKDDCFAFTKPVVVHIHKHVRLVNRHQENDGHHHCHDINNAWINNKAS